MEAAGTPFYTRQGHVVTPTAGALIRPRRGVFAVAIANSLILLVEQKDTNGILELPGGGIEAGESLDQAVVREWGEETGIPFDVKGPLKEYNHTRGFYAEDRDEFWVYDQTFRLYDYTRVAQKDKFWINPEKDRAGWKDLADVPQLRIHQAHGLGIAALLPEKVS